jgi:hypothetical protein
MNCGKAVEEVWTWRETLAKELENVPRNNRVKYINKKADDVLKKYGVRGSVTS